MKKSIFIILVLLAQAFPRVNADAGETSRRYYLPVYESEEILARWLDEEGFKISRIRLNEGKVKLTGSKGRESWLIILKPHSPLASFITAEYKVNGKGDRAKIQELWSYVENYIGDRETESGKANEGMPKGVLSQRESIVCIKAITEEDNIQFSGFFINEKGLIVSTAHDLEDVLDIRVLLSDGREIKGRLVGIDFRRDLALIDIGIKVNSAVSLDKGRDRLKIREKVYAFGCPSNRAGIVSSGVIDGPQRRVYKLPMWEVDMEVQPGSSGSAVFDQNGNLVGIIKGRYRGGDLKGYFIPVETIRDFLKKDDRRNSEVSKFKQSLA